MGEKKHVKEIQSDKVGMDAGAALDRVPSWHLGRERKGPCPVNTLGRTSKGKAQHMQKSVQRSSKSPTYSVWLECEDQVSSNRSVKYLKYYD